MRMLNPIMIYALCYFLLVSIIYFIYSFFIISPRHAVAQLVEALRYRPKVAGSIPDGVIGIFH